MTTVDEAREALLEALAGNRDAPVIDRLNDFETAVRAESAAIFDTALRDAAAESRAEGLDVERLAKALHADRLTTGQCVNTSKTAWRVHLSEAEHIATWYARLAKDGER